MEADFRSRIPHRWVASLHIAIVSIVIRRWRLCHQPTLERVGQAYQAMCARVLSTRDVEATSAAVRTPGPRGVIARGLGRS